MHSKVKDVVKVKVKVALFLFYFLYLINIYNCYNIT